MSGASGGSTHAPTRCLYVALNIPRDASSSDIKKAYRREALVWHPDKNVGNEAEAQVRFQELQHAYAVLSDAHERRWYDDHRDEILNPQRYGGGDNENSDEDEGHGRTVNLTKYFSASAFDGFGDGESGFYQTYSRAFQEVWEAEKDWGDEGESPSTNSGHAWGKGEAPKMGSSRDAFETADVFYSKWGGFVSGLSFGWVDEYNVNEAENRRVRRLMEKENNKRRAVARRKYQDDVRALVEFCRRRDRRVIKHKLQFARDKEARDKRRVQEAQAKKEDMKRRKEEWARTRQEEEEAEEEARLREGGSAAFRLGDSDEDRDARKGRKRKSKRRAGKDNGCGGGEQKVLVFRCAVCKKDFKSAGQMANHETSKAHRKKIEELDAEMLREVLANDQTENGQQESEDETVEDGHSDSDADSDVDRDGEEEDQAEPDFFMDNAMRELDLGSFDSDTERTTAGADGIGGDGDTKRDVDVGVESDCEKAVVKEEDSSRNRATNEPSSTDRGFSSGHCGISEQKHIGQGGKKDKNRPRGRGVGGARAARGFDFGSSSSDEDSSEGNDDSGNDSEERDKEGESEATDIVGVAIETASAAAKTFDRDEDEDEDDSSCIPSGKEKPSQHHTRNLEGHNFRASGGSGTGSQGPGDSSGSESSPSNVDEGAGEELESAGKRGKRRAGKQSVVGKVDHAVNGPGGKCRDDGPAVDKGARRRRRQALKAAKAGGSAGGHGQGNKRTQRAAGNTGSKADVGGRGEEAGAIDSCRVCGKAFPSRSKLFAHVKAEGHAIAT